jgi:hypothetical protein
VDFRRKLGDERGLEPMSKSHHKALRGRTWDKLLEEDTFSIDELRRRKRRARSMRYAIAFCPFILGLLVLELLADDPHRQLLWRVPLFFMGQ